MYSEVTLLNVTALFVNTALVTFSYSEYSVVLACDNPSKRTMDNPIINASNQKKASGQGSGSGVVLNCIDS